MLLCITRLERIYKGSELYRQGLIIGSIGTYDGTNMFERMYPHNDIYIWLYQISFVGFMSYPDKDQSLGP